MSAKMDQEFHLSWLNSKSMAGPNENQTFPLDELTLPASDFDPNAINLFDVPFIDEPHHSVHTRPGYYVNDDAFWGGKDATTVNYSPPNTGENMSANAVAQPKLSTDDPINIDQRALDVSNMATGSNAATQASLYHPASSNMNISAQPNQYYVNNNGGTTNLGMPVDYRVPPFSLSHAIEPPSTYGTLGAAPPNFTWPMNIPTASNVHPAMFGLDPSTGRGSNMHATASWNDYMQTQGSMRLPTHVENNLTSNVGYGQHLIPPQKISTTGYDARAPVPSQMPSTSEASNVNHPPWAFGTTLPFNVNAPFNNSFYHAQSYPLPTTQIPQTIPPPNTSQAPPIKRRKVRSRPSTHTKPSASQTGKAGLVKAKYKKQQLPASELYTVDEEEGGFICRYTGPARVGQCSTKTANVRNLGRHMRDHAVKEIEMELPEGDRVACNGMPEGLLMLKVSCPFKTEDELTNCKFFRENGKRWEVKTLKRWEKAMDAHKAECHKLDGESL